MTTITACTSLHKKGVDGMPKIIQNEAQLKALNEVSEILEKVKLLNDVLSGETACAITAKDGKKVIYLPIAENDEKKILSIVHSNKNRLAKEARTKVEKFHIELSDDEVEILDFEPFAE